MFVSPNLIPCVSVRGTGTTNDAIPRTTKSKPDHSKILINGSDESYAAAGFRMTFM